MFIAVDIHIWRRQFGFPPLFLSIQSHVTLQKSHTLTCLSLSFSYVVNYWRSLIFKRSELKSWNKINLFWIYFKCHMLSTVRINWLIQLGFKFEKPQSRVLRRSQIIMSVDDFFRSHFFTAFNSLTNSTRSLSSLTRFTCPNLFYGGKEKKDRYKEREGEGEGGVIRSVNS